MAHILHTITFFDGTNTVVLEPPDWEEMSYDWVPVSISSLFEAYDGAARKQVNVGAAQKWRLTVSVTGCKDPGLSVLDQSVTWTVTLIDRDDVESAAAYTLWPETPTDQGINPKTARRRWSIRFREE